MNSVNSFIISDKVPIEKKPKLRTAAFILGMVSSTNIVGLFVVGSTPIELSYVYAALLLLYLLIFHTKKISLHMVPNELVFLAICLLMSAIPMLLFTPECAKFWLMGLLQLAMSAIVTADVCILRSNRKQLTNGIIFGLVINICVCLFEFYMYYMQRHVFNFADVFPNMNIYNANYISGFRNQGLFREPGQLMRYIAVMFFITYPQVNRKSYKVLFVLLISFVSIMTKSTSFLVWIVGLLSYVLFYYRRTAKTYLLVLTSVAITALTVVSLYTTFWDDVGLTDLLIDPTSVSDSIRLSGIYGTLKILKEFPLFGSGWGTVPTLLKQSGILVGRVEGSYSYALTIVAQLGIGSVFFFWFVFARGIKMAADTSSKQTAMIGIALLMYGLLSVMTDYSFDAGVAIIFGFVICEYYSKKRYRLGETYGHHTNTI